MVVFVCSFAVLYQPIMQKLQRNWCEIASDLNRCLQSCSLDYRQLSEGSGISYHASRRYLLSGHAKNDNKNARALCRFFGVSVEKTAILQNEPMARITQKIQEVWDGSEPHAELIVELIRSTKAFKIGDRA